MLRYVVLIGVTVQLIGILSYIKTTVQGITRPNRVTWLMWSIAPMVATAAGIASGVTWAAVPVFMSGFAPLLVFLASFVNRNSYWKLTNVDYLCGFLSFFALILWWVTKEPDIAIVFAMASDGLAAVPTIVKGWTHPETETLAPFATGIVNAISSFFAIRVWNFASYAFPIYLTVVNVYLAFVISWRRSTGREE
jgi:hypothetical protein